MMSAGTTKRSFLGRVGSTAVVGVGFGASIQTARADDDLVLDITPLAEKAAPAAAPPAAVESVEEVAPPPPPPPPPKVVTRPPAKSIEVSKKKMGGLLEAYNDVNKGWKINKPSGWNQFDTLPGVYEIKWEDIVASNKEVLMVSTSPVKSTTTSIEYIGDLKEVGEKLAKTRGKELVSAEAVEKEGILFYMYDFKSADARELYQLCINKGRLWSVDASAPNKRWDKVGDLYTNALLSFMPKL